jgi:drug/metabolite transporter (DMT)-like permease
MIIITIIVLLINRQSSPGRTFLQIVYTCRMAASQPPSRMALTFGLILGILAASTAAIFIRFAQADGAASIVIAAARLTIASLILAPLAFTKHGHILRQLTPKDWALALLAGFFLALHFATWITSLEYTSVASSVVLVTTTPLWVALLAPIVLHERLGRLAFIGLLIALVGGTIIGLSDLCVWSSGALNCQNAGQLFTQKSILGDLLALAGAWMAAGYLIVGRKLRAGLPLVPYIFIVYGMAALILLAFTAALGASLVGFQPSAYLWFILLALIPQLLGHSSFNWALKYVPASFVSVILLGEPIGSTVLALMIFREAPGWVKIIGACLLLIGIWFTAQFNTANTSQQ